MLAFLVALPGSMCSVLPSTAWPRILIVLLVGTYHTVHMWSRSYVWSGPKSFRPALEFCKNQSSFQILNASMHTGWQDLSIGMLVVNLQQVLAEIGSQICFGIDQFPTRLTYETVLELILI